ncbi:uncharacterized protein LOC127048993 isoform X1 [Gopherus flavomarginatus]|uniref:uncharacterized protein LOC127048993 isoform X1 n=1 Tax=Gopherus flavomarginatus TaxID=286002 RepID=UPI0021CBB631|nr:uncharacterized protein LOC127048993 isoform X1 [Gopherus flavomarginatus]
MEAVGTHYLSGFPFLSAVSSSCYFPPSPTSRTVVNKLCLSLQKTEMLCSIYPPLSEKQKKNHSQQTLPPSTLTITEIRGRMKRNQLSGVQKCKLVEDKKQKTSEIFQNLPKLTFFFKSNPSEATSSLSSTGIVPKPVSVSESDPSSIGETNTIPEHVDVSETVTDHLIPGGKTDIVLKGMDVSEIEPVHAVNNRRKDLILTGRHIQWQQVQFWSPTQRLWMH